METRKFTQEELKEAFDEVIGAGDWRGPIHTAIHPEDLEIYRAAVIHFTATDLKVTATLPSGNLVVKADGYRNGPAGP